MLNIFKKGHRTLTSDLDTWVVRWNRGYGVYYDPTYEKTAQFFSNKEEAEEFADSLKRANKLLGHSHCTLTSINVDKVTNEGL